MGMHYNVTYVNAIIKPERFEAMLRNEATADMTREELWDAALDYVNGHLDDYESADQNEETGEIDLSGFGYHNHASYSYGMELEKLLSYCEPGAYIHEVDSEESSGEQWRRVLHADGSIKTVYPEIVWPGFDANDLPVLAPEEAARA